jgi:mycothiol synthase
MPDTLGGVSVEVLREPGTGDAEAVRRLADAVESLRGAPPFGEATWIGLAHARDGSGDTTVVGLIEPGPDGVPDAYAQLTRHHGREWLLEVAHRPGTRDERAELVRAALHTVAGDGGGHVTLWLHGATPDDDAVAAAAALPLERELLELRVPLPLPLPLQWPDGFDVRPFVPGRDEAAWVEVNNRAFAGHPEQGAWTVDMLRAREREPWFDPEGFLLAFDDRGLGGFCWTKVHPAAPPREPDARGEIYVIAVDPDRQGTGLGRALVVGGLDSLGRRGPTVGMLFVDAANTAAVGLYESLGFVTHRLDRAYGTTVAADS